MAKNSQAQIVSILRRFYGEPTMENVFNYLSDKMRQNLKTLEYWNSGINTNLTSLNAVAKCSLLQFIVRAAGSIELNASLNPDVKSIIRISAGRYEIIMTDAFEDFNFIESCYQLASGSLASSNLVLRSFDTSLKSITVEFLNGSYTTADIASGTIVRMRIYLKRSLL